MFENAKIGDKVWNIRYGWMKILDIERNDNYPIEVGFDKVGLGTFTFEGKLKIEDLNPTLFWDEIKFEIPPKPLPKLEVDTKVLVWDRDECLKVKRHFSHFDEDGQIMVFANGATSWSTNNTTWSYDNWELYDETNE